MCACVCAANFTPSLAFVYYISSDFFNLQCVVYFSPNPSLPSPFLVQLSSKLLLCDVWEWRCGFFLEDFDPFLFGVLWTSL